jgi:hypothetical protein
MTERRLVGLLAADMVPADRDRDVIRCGTIAAATRHVRSTAPERDRMDHHAAVVAWCRRVPFLPSRRAFSLSSELFQSIERDASMHLARLSTIADRVEITVEVEWHPLPARNGAGNNGQAYLRVAARNLAEREHGLATVQRHLEALAGLFDAELAIRAARIPWIGLHAALLVKRTTAQLLAAKVESALAELAVHFACRVMGPWPPYSFACIGDFR